MIDELTAALNQRLWPDYVIGELGERVGDAVTPFLHPVVGAAMAEPSEGPLPVGVSKVGGLPHVDEAFVWPVEDDTDEPLALVCQINLDDVRKTGVAGSAGLAGMMYLFAIYDSDRAYGYEIDAATAKLLHVPRPGLLTVAQRPDGLADDGLFAERKLRLGPSFVAQERDENGPSSKRFDYEVERAIDEELSLLGGVPCGVVQLLGSPHPFREETREQLDDLGSPQLLLYVNGYSVQRYAFGEGDFLVVVDEAELAAGKLDNAEILFEPGT
ncbi:hypothetical protein Rhe02_35560 [Rhizocola hellebori]|uniref:DUF1963 domain-containing protein n=1 Tax=Rhizocola hellebori TaxID=1392758 RepID=A0A8J3Q7L4_9ACTN|nr:DUF1963 domain-containing protein [Rhizocola hellebori]GIH05489.1 hypothetical protein Rhe02_35560 [Rhizocola hellebori]